MRTTLDLPEDVARLLREESARRGGRGRAPMAQLVAEAVRARFLTNRSPRPRKIGMTRGLPVVRSAYPGERIEASAVEQALAEMP